MTRNRRDLNHSEIVSTLRTMGCSVFDTSQTGNNFPDLVIGFLGKTYLAEIKDGAKTPSAKRLTPGQQEFFESWRGHVCVLTSVDEAIHFVNRARLDQGNQKSYNDIKPFKL